MNFIKYLTISALLCSTINYAYSEVLPNGIAFAGYDSEKWSIYYTNDDSSELKKVDGIKYPRNFTWNRKHKKIAYISVDSKLIEYDIKSKQMKQLVSVPDDTHLTQPKYSLDQERLFAVLLPNGKSRSTQIIEVIDGNQYQPIVRKRTAQFEPFMFDNDYLYYTTVICVNDCGDMIWELWRKDMTTAKQVQLTLGNHVSRQPILKDNKWIYFSSNRAGNYHIWKMENKIGAPAEQITSGEVHDSDISFDKDGNIFFLRRSRNNIKLMKLSKNNHLTEVPLPKQIVDIRNLEIRQ